MLAAADREQHAGHDRIRQERYENSEAEGIVEAADPAHAQVRGPTRSVESIKLIGFSSGQPPHEPADVSIIARPSSPHLSAGSA
jgi:hypothetical protein